MASRSVLISGASTGIGEACALRLADRGWHVFAGVRRDEDGRRLAAAATGILEPVMLDVTDEASVEAALGQVGDRLTAVVEPGAVRTPIWDKGRRRADEMEAALPPEVLSRVCRPPGWPRPSSRP